MGVVLSFFAAVGSPIDQGRSGTLIVPAGRASSPVSRTGLASKFPIARLSQSAINGIVASANAGASADPVTTFSARSLVVAGRGSMELSHATHVDPVDDRIGFRIAVEGPHEESVVIQAPNLTGVDPDMPSISVSLQGLKKSKTYLIVANLWSKNAKGHFVSNYATSELPLPSGSGNVPILLKANATKSDFILWFEPVDGKKLADIVVSSIEIQEVK